MIVWADHVANVHIAIREGDLLPLRADVFQAHVDIGMRLTEAPYGLRHKFRRDEGHVGHTTEATLSFGHPTGGLDRLVIAARALVLLW